MSFKLNKFLLIFLSSKFMLYRLIPLGFQLCTISLNINISLGQKEIMLYYGSFEISVFQASQLLPS